MKRTRRTRSNIGLRGVSNPGWLMVIRYAERKLDQARVKVLQLEALLDDFRHKASRGEPSPLDIANEIGSGNHASQEHADPTHRSEAK